MYKAPILALGLLVAVPALAQDESVEPDDSSIFSNPETSTEKALFHSPWFLPRQLSVGAYLSKRVKSPTARLQWEWTLYHLRRDTLYFLVEGGLAFGSKKPNTVDP